MTKYLMILTALFALVACGGDDGNDPVDKEQPDADTTPAWVTDQTCAGLEWSPLSEFMEWQQAKDHCEAMGARLPTINELRKIIINCPGSTYGGACRVSDPDCLRFDDCWSDDCYCDGTADSYSAFGDKDLRLWSSSSLVGDIIYIWFVEFEYGNIDDGNEDYYAHARCVR